VRTPIQPPKAFDAALNIPEEEIRRPAGDRAVPPPPGLRRNGWKDRCRRAVVGVKSRAGHALKLSPLPPVPPPGPVPTPRGQARPLGEVYIRNRFAREENHRRTSDGASPSRTAAGATVPKRECLPSPNQSSGMQIPQGAVASPWRRGRSERKKPLARRDVRVGKGLPLRLTLLHARRAVPFVSPLF